MGDASTIPDNNRPICDVCGAVLPENSVDCENCHAFALKAHVLRIPSSTDDFVATAVLFTNLMSEELEKSEETHPYYDLKKLFRSYYSSNRAEELLVDFRCGILHTYQELMNSLSGQMSFSIDENILSVAAEKKSPLSAFTSMLRSATRRNLFAWIAKAAFLQETKHSQGYRKAIQMIVRILYSGPHVPMFHWGLVLSTQQKECGLWRNPTKWQTLCGQRSQSQRGTRIQCLASRCY